MVGEAGDPPANEINDLSEKCGDNALLNGKGNFEHSPHLDILTAPVAMVIELLASGQIPRERIPSLLAERPDLASALASDPRGGGAPLPKIDPEFIVVIASAFMNASGFGINYSWDGQRFNNRGDAIQHGIRTRGTDDFNIGQTYGDDLIWFGWMDQRHNEDEGTMREIAASIGLSFDSRWHGLEYSKATGEVIGRRQPATLTSGAGDER